MPDLTSAQDTGSALPLVTVLGDSRVFDTYYVNAAYREPYGFDATFPHLLRKRVLQQPSANYDVVHIPDHFRAGNIESNIIRLALTDPALLILCDGIWETLVHKDWFIEWATNRIRAHPTRSAQALDLSYSSRRLVDLFIANELPVSPRNYVEKQRRIISYFRRRRRQCLWMSLPPPPRGHLDGLHYAGNYRCIPEWDECLKAINDAMAPMVSGYGALWFDLHALVLSHGGFGKALIDQWHFSRSFHVAVADELFRILPRHVADVDLPTDHVSRRFLLAREPGEAPLALYGLAEAIERWRAENPDARVEAVLAASGEAGRVAGLAMVPLASAASLKTRCVVAVEPSSMTAAAEAALLAVLPKDHIVLYPDELKKIVNPRGSDRAEYGRLR